MKIVGVILRFCEFNFKLFLISNVYEFQTFFNKTFEGQYDKSEKYRKKVFENSIKIIKEHNKNYKFDQVYYKMGINQFSDMTSEEFKNEFPVPDTS